MDHASAQEPQVGACGPNGREYQSRHLDWVGKDGADCRSRNARWRCFEVQAPALPFSRFLSGEVFLSRQVHDDGEDLLAIAFDLVDFAGDVG
jgi:hypothetical protein